MNPRPPTIPEPPTRRHSIPAGLRKRVASGTFMVGLLLLWLASPAAATWSVVATDAETGEVGVAIASCVPVELLGDPEQALVPVVLAPGSAAAVTQAQLNLDAPDLIRTLLAAGAEPADIVAELTSPDFDEVAALRQHAVVDTSGGVAAFTGPENSAVALDAQGSAVSVQGNLLTGDDVVTDSLAAFTASRSDGGELSGSLADALLAGSAAGGDRRCPEQTALFAHLAVARPGDDGARPSLVLTVAVEEGDGQNPVEELVASLERGDSGFVDVRSQEGGSGGLVRFAVLAAAAAALVGGLLVFRRGLGSRRARRS